MKRQRIAILSCIGLLSFARPAAAAQPAVKRIKYQVSCPSCAIELTPIATVGGRSDTVSIAATSSLDRDGQGRFFAIGDNFQVLVYDARGRLLKTLGRRGDGPGEFNTRNRGSAITKVVVGPGDSIFVFHPPKVTVYSPQLAYVRTISAVPLSRATSIHALADGTWLMAGENRAPEHVGRSAFIVNPDGSIRRSLGPEQDVIPGRSRTRVVPFTAPPDRRSFWYVDEMRYFFTQWSIDGRQLGSIEIYDAPFVTGPQRVTRRDSRGQPYQDHNGWVGQVAGIDTAGRLWIWGRNVGAKPTELLLEVIDPATGAIVVSQKVMAPVRLLPRGDMAYSWTTDNDGFMTAVVSKYRIVPR